MLTVRAVVRRKGAFSLFYFYTVALQLHNYKHVTSEKKYFKKSLKGEKKIALQRHLSFFRC